MESVEDAEMVEDSSVVTEVLESLVVSGRLIGLVEVVVSVVSVELSAVV